MKINQLFTKKVDLEGVHHLLSCFGLSGFTDKKIFSKYDILHNNTVSQILEMRSKLQQYYLPCKAKVYLENINEKRAITILKQVLRLYGYCLLAKEKNVNARKVVFYQLVNECDSSKTQNMRKLLVKNVINFD